jgi:uncharacterized protein
MSSDSLPVLPERVDARRLAEQGGVLEGRCPAGLLPRLAAQASSVEEATARLVFARDEAGCLLVHGEVLGGITTTCQRCLEPVTIKLESEFEFRPEEEGEEFLPVPGGAATLAEKEVPVRALVEDELLLLCPMIPCHPPGSCRPTVTTDETSPGNGRKNPFDVLAALRQNAEDPPPDPAAARNPEE